MSRLQQFFSTIEISTGNLHLAVLQKIIKEELKTKSGVYGFLSKTTGKLYLGSSINLSLRFNSHINGFKSNVKLQNAINKYTINDFIFIVFEYCEADKLLSREQSYIDSLQPEFNILKTAGSLLGYKHSEETKALMSVAKTGNKNPMFNKTFNHSEETKAKLRKIQKGSKHSQETLAKLSEIFKGNLNPMSKKVFVYKLDSTSNNTVFYKSFNTCSDAAKYLGCTSRVISYYINKNKLYKKEWTLSTTENNLDSK